MKITSSLWYLSVFTLFILMLVLIPAGAEINENLSTDFTAHISNAAISSSDLQGDLPQVIHIGVLANRGSNISMQEWGPTAQYLNKKLNPFRFDIVPLSFNETREAAANRSVSFIIANPSVYTILEYHGLAQRIATLQVPGDPDPMPVFGGVIFTRSDNSDIRTLEDLRGKRFVAVDRSSLGGWQAALLEITRAGLDPDKDFSSLNFTQTHDAAALAVLSGEADAGTVRSTQLERMAKEGKIDLTQLTILNDQRSAYPHYPYLLSTSLYPEWPFAAVTGTDKELSKLVSVALLMMDPDDPAAKANRGAGWAIPQDHTTVHELLRTLHLPPYENYGKPTIGEVIEQYWQTILVILVGIIILSILLLYTWQTKRSLAQALVQVRESELAIRASRDELTLVHEELAESRNRLLDSIQYAKLIQQSVLPADTELDACISDYHIILQPLDLVGGDFYFFRETKDGFCIAAVDCTGHGVPGAFMTMMVNALLNRVIDLNPDDTPAAMLEQLHHLVQDTLRSQTTSGHLENGLDIALCRVYPEEQYLLFAGGGLPLIIARGGHVQEIPGDRLHLGFSSARKSYVFTDHRVDISHGSRYYLVTDGVFDIPGGQYGYGLGRNGLLAIIQGLSNLPLDKQKEQLLSELKAYQNQYPRKDDMLVIGFGIRGGYIHG